RSAAYWLYGPAPSLHRLGLAPTRDGEAAVTLASARLNRHGRAALTAADLVIVGADTIGGDYEHRSLAAKVEALNRAAAAGRAAKLVNSSVPASPTALSVRILRNLDAGVEVWARDRPSQSLLGELLERRVRVAPDIGALLTPTSAPRRPVPHPSGYAVFVPNAHFHTHHGLDRAALLAAWVRAVRLIGATVPVIVMPHETRPFPGDIAMAEDLAAGSGARLYRPADAADAKALLAGAAVCVSARLHACLGALSTGTPTLGLEYLDKFRGQFAWFGDRGRVLPFETTRDAERIGTEADALLRLAPGEAPEIDGWYDDSWL
ncbi:MAG: hypothetical protein QOE37_290, partial [Microbacteriaceae bacterium]|nr:hypothetical protein [Microbacteriaceae bacterium]